MNDLSLSPPPANFSAFDAFHEALADQGLRYRASQLQQAGFEPPEELYRAIGRAVQVCHHCGVPVREHFKRRYVSDDAEHTVRPDWMLSRFAYTLVMINGTTENPTVSQLQFELIRKLL